MTVVSDVVDDVVAVATERIEAEVCTLAGQIAAATCRFVLLVAELDRRETWREWGLRSTAQWLSWKSALGIIARASTCGSGGRCKTFRGSRLSSRPDG